MAPRSTRSDIFLWVLLAVLVLPAEVASLVGDTHLVVTLNLPSAGHTQICRDQNPLAVGTVMRDDGNAHEGELERLV